MMKLVLTQLKWAVGLIILVVAILLIGGCTPANQAKGGEATTQLTIGVAVNHPPVIDSLTKEWEKVRKAATSDIECIASDPDGDELIYIWSVGGGNISGEGPAVTWVAPNAYGTYTVTVTVTDGRGGVATESTPITVCSCPGAGS